MNAILIILGSGATKGSDVDALKNVPCDYNFFESTLVKTKIRKAHALRFIKRELEQLIKGEILSLEKLFSFVDSLLKLQLGELCHPQYLEAKNWLAQNLGKTFSELKTFIEQCQSTYLNNNPQSDQCDLSIDPCRLLGNAGRQLRKIMWEVLWRATAYQELDHNGNNINDAYSKLQRFLKTHGYQFNIISFNYDTYAEYALNLPLAMSPTELQHGGYVIKPHGSLHIEESNTFPITRDADVNVFVPCHHELKSWYRKRVDFQVDSSGYRQPAIVPPVSTKIDYLKASSDAINSEGSYKLPEFIARQWQIAQKVLSNTQKILFIGYGFPQTDRHALDLFTKGKLATQSGVNATGNPISMGNKQFFICDVKEPDKGSKENRMNTLFNGITAPKYCWNGFARLVESDEFKKFIEN